MGKSISLGEAPLRVSKFTTQEEFLSVFISVETRKRSKKSVIEFPMSPFPLAGFLTSPFSSFNITQVATNKY